MTLIEEKTLHDHDINVRSIRQELQLLEEQLKKHGRNESQLSPTVTDEDTVSRKAAIKAIRDTYRVSYPIDMISKDDAADVLTELPSVTLTITADTDTISRQATINAIQKHFNPTGAELSPDLASVLAGVGVVINMMPPSPSKSQWIPVTGRMPETNKDVLLTSWNGNSQYVGWLDDLGTWHSEDEEVIKGYEPIAWMPLPEPYEV